jgi:predicted metalloprotease with PDZ domain
VAKDPRFANDFFRRYVEGREVPDFAALFAPAGFRFSQDSLVKPFFGASMDSVAKGVVINWASEVGSAYAAGLSDGDVVLAVDGEPVTSPAVLGAIISRHRVGDVVGLEVLQKGVVPSAVSIPLNGLPRGKLETFESAGLPISEAMRALRGRWLSSKIVRHATNEENSPLTGEFAQKPEDRGANFRARRGNTELRSFRKKPEGSGLRRPGRRST